MGQDIYFIRTTHRDRYTVRSCNECCNYLYILRGVFFNRLSTDRALSIMPFNSSFPSQTLYLSSAALLSSLSLFYLVYRSQSDTPTTLRKAIPAPSVDESVKDPELPYPPDVFPGARDVDSPYGKLRVYEWGPEDGRKVLFVHGITVPCLSLGKLWFRG